MRISHADRATWDAVDSFSLCDMQTIAETHAPVLWHLASSYVNPNHKTGHVRQHRPQNLVCCSVHLHFVINVFTTHTGVYKLDHVNDI
jgi:hypothetical protein